MEPASAVSSPQPTPPASNTEHHSTKASADSAQIGSAHDSPSSSSPASGISSWAKHLKLPLGAAQQNSQTENNGMSAFARLTSGIGLRMPSNETAPANSGAEQPNLIESFTRGLMDSSKSAVKAMQTKARHIVSQNKRRYQVSCQWHFMPASVLPMLLPYHGLNHITDLCYHVQICSCVTCSCENFVHRLHGLCCLCLPLERVEIYTGPLYLLTFLSSSIYLVSGLCYCLCWQQLQFKIGYMNRHTP